MNRRDALALLLASAVPAAAQPAQRRIAWVSPGLATEGGLFLDALRRGLRERGYEEGIEIPQPLMLRADRVIE